MSDNAETVCPTCKGKGRIDVTSDAMQGMTHHIYAGYGSVTYPRTTEPRKTWLDECAMMAMQAVLSNSVFETFRQELDKTVSEERQKKAIAEMCYDYAEAMLAEKMKREAKE